MNDPLNDGYMADGDELDACDYAEEEDDQDILFRAGGLPEAIEALTNKYNADFFAQADDEERRKRANAKAEEDSWWTSSKPLLMELLFESLSEAPSENCECHSEEPISVFGIDIKGKPLHVLLDRASYVIP
jgi:hypothetical protein